MNQYDENLLIKVVDHGDTYKAVLMTGTGEYSNIKASSTAGYDHAARAVARKMVDALDGIKAVNIAENPSRFRTMVYFKVTVTREVKHEQA